MSNIDKAQQPRVLQFNNQNPQRQFNPQFDKFQGEISKNIVKQNSMDRGSNNLQMFAEARQRQVTQLCQFYKVSPQNLQQVQQLFQECYLVDMQLKGLVLRIKLLVDKQFPKSEPKLFSTQYLSHQIVNAQTWEIEYQLQFPPWNQQSQLKDLFATIYAIFSKDPPMEDQFIQQINSIKNQFNEEKEIQKLKDKDLTEIFPNVKPEKYKDILEGEELKQYIFNQPEYKNLAKYVVNLVETNERFAKDLIERNQKLFQQKEELTQNEQIFKCLQNDLISKYKECQMIKERFEKTKVLSFLEQEINQIDEQSNQKLEGMDGSIQLIRGQQDRVNLEQDVQKYLELRKRYHRLVIKKEKFAEIM